MLATGRPGLCETVQAWGVWLVDRTVMRIYAAADRIQEFDEQHVQPRWVPWANHILALNEINMDLILGLMSVAEPLIPRNSITRLKELSKLNELRLQPNNADPNVGTEGDEVNIGFRVIVEN